MKIKIALVASLVLLGLLPACGSPVSATQAATGMDADTLYVFAAASLTEAFTEIGRLFEAQHPGLMVVFNFGGSQHLAQQLADGAYADVFASANKLQMEATIQTGRVARTHLFVYNQLVVIFPKDNPAGLEILQDLARPGLKLVLAAQEVPIGRYALDLLSKASQDPAFGAAFAESVLENVVSYENNVKIVLTKNILGEADAGIVYTSDITGEGAAEVGLMEIPDALNVVAAYPIAVIEDSHNPEMAQAFVDFVVASEGQTILAQFGFLPVVK